MNINERIRFLRKEHLKLNQTDFALLLGMKQTSVSSFEKDGATVTEQTIKSICLAVKDLNEEWLRNGVEPMFIEKVSDSIDEIIERNGASDIEISIVKTYFELDQELRSQILDHFKAKFAKSTSVKDAEDEYIKSRSNSVQNTDLSALNIISEKNNA